MAYGDWGSAIKRVSASPFIGTGIQQNFANKAIPLPVKPIIPELPPQQPPPQQEPPPEYYEDVGPPPGEDDSYQGGGPPGYAVPPSPTPVTPAPVTPAPAVPDPMVPTPVVPSPVVPSPVTPGPVTPMPGTFDPNDPWKGHGSAKEFAAETQRRIDKKLAGTQGVDWQWSYPAGGWGSPTKVPIGSIW